MVVGSSRRLALLAMSLALLPGAAVAQAPPGTIDFQGKLTDNTSQQNPFTGVVAMRFAIWDDAFTGTKLWQEPAAGAVNVPVRDGLFSIVLGSAVPVPATLFSGATSARYLEITMDPAGSADILSPRQRLVSRAYAGRSDRASSADAAASAPLFTGVLAGDVGGTQPATSVGLVGGIGAAIVSSGTSAANGATSGNAAGALVKRDAGGGFAAGTITASLNGSATTATLAATTPSFTGSLSGDVTGTQGATVTATVGGRTAAQVSASVDATLAATPNATPQTIVRRGPAGAVTAGTLAAAPVGDGSAVTGTTAGTVGTLARPGFVETAFDAAAWGASIAIGNDGLAVISYHDDAADDMEVARCADAACTSFTVRTLDPAGIGGALESSITIGADGLPLVAYEGSTGLKVAHCDDATCGSATIATIGAAPSSNPSIAIGTDGRGIVSFLSAGSLKVAHCGNTACSSSTIATVAPTGPGAVGTALAIGADGRAVIAFPDESADHLSVAHCGNVTCSTATVSQLTGGGGTNGNPSITIGADGLPLVAGDASCGTFCAGLQLFHCSTPACTASTATGFVLLGSRGHLAIGADGLPFFSSSGGTFGRCADETCSTFSIVQLGGLRNGSATVGTDGLPIVATYGTVVHLSNVLGMPHVRPR